MNNFIWGNYLILFLIIFSSSCKEEVKIIKEGNPIHNQYKSQIVKLFCINNFKGDSLDGFTISNREAIFFYRKKNIGIYEGIPLGLFNLKENQSMIYKNKILMEDNVYLNVAKYELKLLSIKHIKGDTLYCFQHKIIYGSSFCDGFNDIPTRKFWISKLNGALSMESSLCNQMKSISGRGCGDKFTW
jgi:hypothetical protein